MLAAFTPLVSSPKLTISDLNGQGIQSRVRWKLTLIASLVAALVGAGASILLIHLFGAAAHGRVRGLPLLLALLAPLLATALAGFSVYRRTARRRKLQAFAAVLLSLLLTLTALLLTSFYFTGRAPRVPADPLPAPHDATT